MAKAKTKAKPEAAPSDRVVLKTKLTLQIRIELIDAATGAVTLWRDFTAEDPVRVTAGGGAKQPKGSLWHALRELSDVHLIGRKVGDSFEQRYELPWGAYDPKKRKTFTGQDMQDLLGIWQLATWQDAAAARDKLFVSNAWANGRVVEVDATKIVLDGNGHAGKHLQVAGKILAVAPK